MKKNTYWYKVDNAGKIFPAVSNEARSSVFRLTFYLNDIIDPALLAQAVNEVLPRFEPFAVELKKGFFWYYLSRNQKPLIVKEEPEIMCKYVPWSKNNGYLLNVYYYKNKIVLETFHSLSDGTGAMEFLKSITYRYLTLNGHPLEHEGMILSQVPNSKQEALDMFCHSYDNKPKKKLQEEPAYHMKGEKFPNAFSMCVRIKAPTTQLLDLARKKEVTLSEYVTGLLAYSIYHTHVDCQKSKKPIKMFIPVNLRRFFPSSTIRNFSLYIKATFPTQKDWTLDEMLKETKQQFADQLNQDDLHQRINSNVGIEQNLLIRLLPLALKNLAFKLGYHYLAEDINTYSISNLGTIKLPESMQPHVQGVEFSIGGTNMGIVSYNDKTCLTMNTQIKDLSIIQAFIKTLTSEGIDVSIDTNYREGYDEIL